MNIGDFKLKAMDSISDLGAKLLIIQAIEELGYNNKEAVLSKLVPEIRMKIKDILKKSGLTSVSIDEDTEKWTDRFLDSLKI